MLMLCVFLCVYVVGYTTKDLVFMWQSGDPVQMDEISLPQFDVKQEDIKYGNCTKFYQGTGMDSHIHLLATLLIQFKIICIALFTIQSLQSNFTGNYVFKIDLYCRNSI